MVDPRKDASERWDERSPAAVPDQADADTWFPGERDVTGRSVSGRSVPAHGLRQHRPPAGDPPAGDLARDRAQVLELAAKNAPLGQVLAKLGESLERQFGGQRAALVLPGEPPEVYTAQGESNGGCEARPPAAGEHGAGPPAGPLADGATSAWRHAVTTSDGSLLGTIFLQGRGGWSPSADELAQLDAAGQLAGLVIERYAAQAALERLALYDPLTNLPNRVLFERELARVLTQVQGTPQAVAVGLMDLDRFKLINDTLGHSVGDALLQQVAVRLRGALGSRDTLARMGGDEFLLLLGTPATPQGVQRVAERLLHTFSQPFVLAGREVFVRPSIGFSVLPHGAAVLEQLLQQADTAMYQAKRRGGGYALYSPEGDGRLAAITLESGLHRALERQEFVLHYQPQFETRTGRLIGAEALLRWQHPDLGLVPPAEFIPLAEVTGLIVPIGAWVLREACGQAAAWTAVVPDLRLAVNLSARQFQQPNLIETVTWALQSSGLAPQQLELELTESMLMQAAEAGETLERLKALGVRLVVDDFGTGYSNLAYLKQYPIDALKIDRTFTADIGGTLPTSGRDEVLVKAVMNLAHALDLAVTVEGVEHQTQLDFLRRHNCDHVQGYLIGRPQSAARLERRLRELAALT
jgi:diguanylate cyclase (GGDEF)-like protein